VSGLGASLFPQTSRTNLGSRRSRLARVVEHEDLDQAVGIEIEDLREIRGRFLCSRMIPLDRLATAASVELRIFRDLRIWALRKSGLGLRNTAVAARRTSSTLSFDTGEVFRAGALCALLKRRASRRRSGLVTPADRACTVRPRGRSPGPGRQ
jgi:hypothetical protein